MAHALLPDPKALALDNIAVREGIITFPIRTTAAIAACPDCGCCSERVHSRYQRTLQDLPWQGNSVRFFLTVRRFFCGNAACTRKIFAETPVMPLYPDTGSNGKKSRARNASLNGKRCTLSSLWAMPRRRLRVKWASMFVQFGGIYAQRRSRSGSAMRP